MSTTKSAAFRMDVHVINRDFKVIPYADVRITTARGVLHAKYDAERGVYWYEEASSGIYIITVDAEGYEPQARTVTCDRGVASAEFVLGRPGDAYTFFRGRQFPYRSHPGEIGLIGWFDDPAALAEIATLIDGTGYHVVSAEGDGIGPAGNSRQLLLRCHGNGDAKQDSADTHECLRRLRLAGHTLAGPIFNSDHGALRVFTHRLGVTFNDGIDPATVGMLLREKGIQRHHQPVSNSLYYVAELEEGIGEEINQTIAALMADDRVADATAEIAGAALPLGVEPDDFLRKSLWDRRLVRCPEAWERLGATKGEAKQFGDPNIIIAIVDDGINSENGIPKNEDFLGPQSNHFVTHLNGAVDPPSVLFKVAPGHGVQTTWMAKLGIEGNRSISLIDSEGIHVTGVARTYDAGSEISFIPPSGSDAVLQLLSRVSPKPSTINVDSTKDSNNVVMFHAGQAVSIGAQGAAGTEDVIILEVIDNGATQQLKTTPLRNHHDDDAIVEVGRKVYKLYNFDRAAANDPPTPNNDAVVLGRKTGGNSNHGIVCAGIAAGAANNEEANDSQHKKFGLVGVAPNARLIGIMNPNARFSAVETMFAWAAGVENFMASNQGPFWMDRGADIINYSYTGSAFGADQGNDGSQGYVNRMLRRGRNGKGTIIVISAGNDHVPLPQDDLVSLRGTFAVAATTLEYNSDVQKVREVAADYTNFSNPAGTRPKQIAWSAPGGGNGKSEHAPPLSYLMISATFNGEGNLPGSAAVQTYLTSDITGPKKLTNRKYDVRMGDTKLYVRDSSVVSNNEWIRVGDVGDTNIEWLEVKSKPDATTIELKNPAQFDHISYNKFEDVNGIVQSVTSKKQFVVHFTTPNTVISDGEDARTLRVGGLIRVTIGGVEYWGKVVDAGGAGTAESEVVLLEDLPVLPSVNDPVYFPKVVNFNSEVIGSHTIEVNQTKSGGVNMFPANSWILVGNPGESQVQAVYVQSTISDTKLLVSGLLQVIDSGNNNDVMVTGGRLDYVDNMAGTSFAAPVVSGIAALALSANPALTWLELEELLDLSTVKVDPGIGYLGKTKPKPDGTEDLSAVDCRWKDLEGRPIVGIQGPFQDKSVSTTIANTSPGPNNTTVSMTADKGFPNFLVSSVTNMQRGAALTLAALGNVTRERLVIKRFTSLPREVFGDRAMKYSHASGTPVVSGKGKITAGASAGASLITLENTQSFVPGQEIRISSSGRANEDVVIKDIQDDTHLLLDGVLSRDIFANETVTGGRVASFIKMSVQSTVQGADGAQQGNDWVRINPAHAGFFEKGHRIVLPTPTKEEAWIKDVVTAGNEVKLILENALSDNHPANASVITGFTTLSATASDGATVLHVNEARSFVIGQAIMLESTNEVLSVIVDIDSMAGELTVNPPIWVQVGSGKEVYGGRIPYRSAIYGTGRLDADMAVEHALAYTHEMRDLMIRSYEGDNGSTMIDLTAKALESPDIWVRHSDPSADEGAIPSLFRPLTATSNHDPAYAQSVADLHETSNPLQKDIYIYARIKNKGSDRDGLQSRARFHVYRTRSNPPYVFDSGWKDDEVFNSYTYEPGAYVISDDVVLFDLDKDENIRAMNDDGTGNGIGGIKHGQHHIVRGKWESSKLPPSGRSLKDRLRTFLLVEITPQDGPIAPDRIEPDGTFVRGGTRVGENNNLAMREISFMQVRFKNTVGNDELNGESKGKKNSRSPKQLQKPFKIEFDDPIGYFRMKELEVLFTFTAAVDGQPAASKVVVRATWNGTKWVYATPGPNDTWTPMAQNPTNFKLDDILKTIPTTEDPHPDDPSKAVDAEQTSIYTTGWIDVLQIGSEWQIEVRLNSQVDPTHKSSVILRTVKPIKVITPVKTNGTEGDLHIPGRVSPQLHGFADMTRVTQEPEHAYGAKSEKKYALTSRLTVKPGAPACIYAAATGLVMVQRVFENNAFSNDLVNVIIKPLYRSAITMTPVKYFIYRGLRRQDFFSDNWLNIQASGASEFITQLHTQHETRRQAAQNGSNPGASTIVPDATPLSLALGWDPDSPATTDAEKFFGVWNKPGVGSFQLPLVRMGTCIGTLGEGAELGFEVVLDEGRGVHTLEFARARYWEVDLEGRELTAMQERYLRESILGFVDPAAYYGLHSEVGVYAREGSGVNALSTRRERNALFSDILTPFATRSTLYLDVRSENSFSMNFYRNYNADGGNLRFGSTGGELSTEYYDAGGWPLVAATRSIEEAQKTSAVYLALPVPENPNGTVYLEHGAHASDTGLDRFIGGGNLRAQGDVWTREIGLAVPQVTINNEKRDVASILKLHYGRGATADWPASSKVPVVQRYNDNLFGPIDIADRWVTGSTAKTRWMSINQLKYVEGTSQTPSLSFGTMVERGAAFQEGQVVLFTAAVDFNKLNAGTNAPMPAGTGVEGGFSTQPTLLTSSALFGGFEFEEGKVTDTPVQGGGAVNITTVRLVPTSANAVPEGLMVLGLAQAQFDALYNKRGELSDKHSRNIVLKEDALDLVSNGITFHRYRAELRGLDEQTLLSKDVPPDSAIYVYTRDGLTFVPGGFTMPKLLPPSYTPTKEEQRAVNSAGVDAKIDVISDVRTEMNAFITKVNAVLENTANARQQIIDAIDLHGAAILTKSQNFTLVQGSRVPDDQPLYWSRLRMLATLKENPYLLANPTEWKELVGRLDRLSRGYDAVSFSGAPVGAKKILITGFDPFDIDDATGLPISNPSGVIALALHGQQLTCAQSPGKVGYVQSMIFPVRYRDFDAGVVEQAVHKYLFQEPVHMIITISQNGGDGHFFIERFASRKRGDGLDAEDARGVREVGSAIDWDPYYETTLPKTDMLSNPTPGPLVYYNQFIEAKDAQGGRIWYDLPTADAAYNHDADASIPNLAQISEVTIGSGGDYLSNEIFYRVARERQRGGATPSAVRTGHLHIPAPEYTDGPLTIGQVIAETKSIICKGLKNIS